jgi:transcriptional regulator with XRE-family HTH domain
MLTKLISPSQAGLGYHPNMGLREAADVYFGTHVRRERELRGWSQEELAKRLTDKGIHVYASTIAKIESEKKPRAARLGEAAGIADLFGVSLDALLGRKPGVQTDELVFQQLRLLRDTAMQSSQQVWASMETIRQQLGGLPKGFEGADTLQELGDSTCRNFLYPAYDALMGLVELSQELLRREEGGPDLSKDSMEALLQKAFRQLEVLSHLQRKQTEADDEPQS